MYYGLFIKVGHRFVRVDTTTGYTIDTAKEKFKPLIAVLGGKAVLRPLSPIKLIDSCVADRKYAHTPW